MILGILGGMGPAASCELYRKITELTKASVDQEHIHILIDSNTQIPDRTSFICGSGKDPRYEMIRSIEKLELMGADYIAIPCNTAHYFYNDLLKYTKVDILNMIQETAKFIEKTYPKEKDFFLLATKGTYISKIYTNTFSKSGLNIIEPDALDKEMVMKWIGSVKSGKYDVSIEEFEQLIEKYAVKKNIRTILGCTELPLLAKKFGLEDKYIDPVTIIARRCVEIAQKSRADLSPAAQRHGA